MKSFHVLFILSIILISCHPQEKPIQNTSTVQPDEIAKNTTPKAENNNQSLVLTFDALQLVDQISGSSDELPFGTPQNQLIEIINNTFQSDAVSIDVNAECGAGPLKMMTWNNGLTLVFQENNTKSAGSKIDWLFQGWSVDGAKDGVQKLTTMAGIGIGSTLDEIQSAYEIEVRKTSLGYEFSTAAGMYGILDGAGKDAKITHLWSGVSCNFR
jgi:hypothetical protein